MEVCGSVESRDLPLASITEDMTRGDSQSIEQQVEHGHRPVSMGTGRRQSGYPPLGMQATRQPWAEKSKLPRISLPGRRRRCGSDPPPSVDGFTLPMVTPGTQVGLDSWSRKYRKCTYSMYGLRIRLCSRCLLDSYLLSQLKPLVAVFTYLFPFNAPLIPSMSSKVPSVCLSCLGLSLPASQGTEEF